MLWFQRVQLVGCLTRTKHRRQVTLLRVDLELVERPAFHSANIVMRVNKLLSLLELRVDTIVHRSDFTVFKLLLSGAMTQKQVHRCSFLHIDERLIVVLVLFVVLKHTRSQ